MKIGFFTDTYLPTPTGTSVVIEAYRNGLEREGHEVFVIAPNFPHYEDKSKNIIRVPSLFLPNRPEIPLAKPIGGKFAKQIGDLELDIIHTFSIYSTGNYGLKIGKVTQKPIVFSYDSLYTEHTKYYRPIFKPFAKSWYQNTCRRHANQCNTVIVPSPSARKLALEYGIVSPLAIVPAGINTDDFVAITPDTLRSRFSIPSGQDIILSVTRIDEENNIRFLLRSFKEVWIKRENTHLLLIGRGPQEEVFQKIAQGQPFADNITFCGFMPKGELNKIYGACDLFVFPSTTATQALAVIEAMAAGIPVVAINRLAPSDIIRDGEDGYLTPLNEQAFSARILYLLQNNKLRNHFGRIARANAKKFSVQNSIIHLLEVYNKLLK